ncbi:hypothetical protein [Epilithonimonas arachidiradicis]|uniref:Tail tube protein n=1 Tax=Epilithonimonas arachidiradicis TaxID=1617282 RepID=A0A420DEE4_9FLAO|nr:hypothetical protein [Epilithonimonas arachidiradicis]RKE90007.1 hypothetical protein BXY58_0592 [Epilithonimonas arachidiradicis]GGG47046.1 hypothetical protein GCM10007332_05670 [Epilithonimonas arachidiradicis]
MPDTFDSKQYSWSDVSISLGGRIVTGVTSVEYSRKQEKSILRGRGSKGHKIVRGNEDFEGKITIWQSEFEAMTRDAPGKNHLRLEFDLTIAYVPEDGGQTVTDTCKTCEFTEGKKTFNQGDGNMLVELPFIFLDLIPQS